MQTMNYSSEDLKVRMLRHMSVLWGVKHTDALDPLVKILAEALSGELQKTHHEIQTFEKRILEKIALLLTPGILASPYCAHAVAHARSTEPKDLLPTSASFVYTKKKSGEKDGLQNIPFTPAGSVMLFDGFIQYIIAGNKAYTTNEQGHKLLFMQGLSYASPDNTIWLALKLSPAVKSIHQMGFYFDFAHTEHKTSWYSILHSSKWSLNKKELRTSKGLIYADKPLSHPVFPDIDAMHVVEREVRHLYDDCFISINDERLEAEDKAGYLQHYPEELQQLFSAGDLTAFQEKLLWIKIVTPASIDERVLSDLFVRINAFPVINRKLMDSVHRAKGIHHVLPIQTGMQEYFLSVSELTDSTGKEYVQIPFSIQDSAAVGTYTLRKNGTERMDSRSSKEYIQYLVDLIRDESAAFAGYGQDAVHNLLRDLDRSLAQLDQRIRKNPAHQTDAPHYVTIEYQQAEETFFMKSWITNSIHANGIHAGTRLSSYRTSNVHNGSVQLLTPSMGGKRSLDPSRHIDAYRYAVLTHQKLVTAEDIKAFCQYELGNKIASVNIRKGLIASAHPKEGLVRCIEVLLKRNAAAITSDNTEWELDLKSLQSKMEQRSSLHLTMKLVVVE